MRRLFLPFFTFIALFIGTGFVSGSIVHMGEGVNTWDASLLIIGVVLFVSGSVAQDVQQGMKRMKGEGIALFLLLSLLLSIGIGMASGGMQHFVDTPSYSAVLIPLGLGIGFLAFILKERLPLSVTEWALIVPAVGLCVILFIVVLRTVGSALPETLRQDHHHQVVSTSSTDDAQSSAHSSDDGHEH